MLNRLSLSFGPKAQAIALNTQPQQLAVISGDATFEPAVTGEQIIDPGTLRDVPFDGERVANQPGFDRGAAGVGEAALVVVDPSGMDEVVEAANGGPAGSDPQQLYLACGEAI